MVADSSESQSSVTLPKTKVSENKAEGDQAPVWK